ncbi:hypothetical protein RND71_014567 [Anisodus tanguticus]|uniref:Uncharacterized protein n=1 Tax=Anisodus tanguticus TaxID=243964 RepID=A0AAE1SBQ7_9SOLA|nr:hypothetical protein RND71_014567 [Anisodus tanguticus]
METKEAQNIINKRRKSVRFRVVNDNDDVEGQEIMKKGVVRIRVVVTQEELKQILNGQLAKDEFFEKGCSSTIWRPVLDSIPEDH